MLKAKIPDEARSWDAFKAFHCAVDKHGFGSTNHYGGRPVVLFDTNEVIITDASPRPDIRGHYAPLGIELTTSKDLDLWLPDGTACAKAWLDDGGMQYLVNDLETHTAVRLDGSYRHRPNEKLTPGVPYRFQFNSRVYIPGPGMRPIAHDKIKVKRPLRSCKQYTTEQFEHIHMIVATGQAAMKLTNHEALTRGAGKYLINPEVLLKCKTWLDVPEALLPTLAQHGCTHTIEEYDYLLTVAP